MDIVALLRKRQKEIHDLTIRVTGELSKQAPIEYISIHLVYEFTGDESNKEAAMEAVDESQNKYCGVSHMLKKAVPVSWEVNYNGVQLFNNGISKTLSLN